MGVCTSVPRIAEDSAALRKGKRSRKRSIITVEAGGRSGGQQPHQGSLDPQISYETMQSPPGHVSSGDSLKGSFYLIGVGHQGEAAVSQ